MLLNLKKISLLLLITLLNTQRVDVDDAIADNGDACSFVWGISDGFNAIDLSHGTIEASLGLAPAAAARKAVKTWAARRQFGGGKKSR